MSILKVARLGHPVLRNVATDVEVADIRKGRFRQLIDDMFETMLAYQGVGLAGPQVHIPHRIFVFGVEEEFAKRRRMPEPLAGAYFNVQLERVEGEDVTDWEGCLSVPFLTGQVTRVSKVILRAIDAKGDPVEIPIEGYTARIFQHEVDHCDGHVYLDRMADLTSLAYTIVL